MGKQTRTAGVANLLAAPWAIIPDRLIEMQRIYAAHLRGETIDLAAVEARIGKPLNNQVQGYTVQDGVAVLPLEGVISKRMNLFSEISGGTSSQLAQRDFQAALTDPAVKAIVLLLDSPGGEVDGTQVLADAIYSARGKKPIVALADGFAASAAYWIGSAADKMYITSDTTAVGSIGIVATHVDYSKAEAQRGVTVTEIAAGKYKRIASEHAPLSEEGRSSIQDQVDHVYGVFVDAVARNRGVSSQTVLDKMAEGKLFLGKQAISAGLVDGMSSLGKLVAHLGATTTQIPSASAVSVAAKSVRQLLTEDADQVRRQPWGQSAPTVAKAAVVTATVKEEKMESPMDSEEVGREAQALQVECGRSNISINTADAVDHVMARRKGTMSTQQLARAAQIEQARAAARGVAISVTEALSRAAAQR